MEKRDIIAKRGNLTVMTAMSANQNQPRISSIQSFSSILLRLILHKGKISSYPYIYNLPIWFKVSFQVTYFCMIRKINNK